jgi:hypothetical protein
MTRRPLLRSIALLVAVAFLLPLVVAVADSCEDCLRASCRDCCPASCCPCCAHAFPVRRLAPVGEELSEAGLAGEPVENRALPAAPRDIFHVPKSFLA